MNFDEEGAVAETRVAAEEILRSSIAEGGTTLSEHDIKLILDEVVSYTMAVGRGVRETSVNVKLYADDPTGAGLIAFFLAVKMAEGAVRAMITAGDMFLAGKGL